MAARRKKSAEARAVELAVHSFSSNLSAITQSASAPDIFWGRALLDTVLVSELETRRLGPGEDEQTRLLVSTLECVECSREVQMAGPYCNDFCNQITGAVRYARKGVAESRWDDTMFHEGLGRFVIKLGKAGYPARERRLSPKLRKSIFERD